MNSDFVKFKKAFLRADKKQRAKYRRFILGDRDCTGKDLEGRTVGNDDDHVFDDDYDDAFLKSLGIRKEVSEVDVSKRKQTILFYGGARGGRRSRAHQFYLDQQKKKQSEEEVPSFKKLYIPGIHFDELTDDSSSEYNMKGITISVDHGVHGGDQTSYVAYKKENGTINMLAHGESLDDLLAAFPGYEKLEISSTGALIATPKKGLRKKLKQKITEGSLFF